MERGDTEHVVQLLAAQRLPNSRNGNPRYRLAVRPVGGLTMFLLTMSDISDAYAIGNPGLRPDDWVRVTLSRAGRVRHISPARRPSDE
jgi:hypothetical protein